MTAGASAVVSGFIMYRAFRVALFQFRGLMLVDTNAMAGFVHFF